MNTLKTSVVVVLLLAVLYGVYVVLSEPEPQPPAEIGWREEIGFTPPQIDFGEPVSSPFLSDSAGSPEGRSITPSPANDLRAAGAPNAASPSPPTTTLGLPEPLDPPRSPAANKERAGAAMEAAGGPEAPVGLHVQIDSQPAAGRSGETVGAADPRRSDSPASASAAAEKRRTAERLVAHEFQKARRTAQSQIENGRYHDALFTLSIFYDSPDLEKEELRELVDVLDALAAKVIYSGEHHLEPPYRVGRDDTLMDIAKQYNVPWQLLRNINGISDPLVLVPGSELKVVRGPFRADVNLDKSELTLFLGRLYAGRFPISTGNDPAPMEGDYQVREKRADRAYYTRDGRTIPSQHADNPYGRAWLHLGGEMCIHGSPASSRVANSALGCISLSPIDADDVYGILSQGSKVTIRR